MAACLYRYFVDQHEFLYGPLDDDAADAVYRDAKRLGTTLQVPRGHVARRPGRVRRLLEALAGRAADRPAGARAPARGGRDWRSCRGRCARSAGPFNLFATTGFLPAEFRDDDAAGVVGVASSAGSSGCCRALRLADRLIPHRGLDLSGYQLYLWDMRSRARPRPADRVNLAATRTRK